MKELAVGDRTHGYCRGIFGRDHYDCCEVVHIASGYAVLRKIDIWGEGNLFLLAQASEFPILTESRDNDLGHYDCTCPGAVPQY